MWKRMLDDLPGGVCVIDKETYEIVYVNKAMKSTFFLEEESVGKTCYQCIMHACSPCDHCSTSCGVCRERIVKNSRGESFLMKGKDYTDGQRTLHVEFISNLTEQVDAEKIAGEGVQTFTTVLEQSKLLYWEYDLDTHTCYRTERFVSALGGSYVAQNIPEELEMCGYTAQRDVERVRELYRRILRGEKEVEAEVRLNFISGEKLCRVHLTTIYDSNRLPIKAVGTIESLEALNELESCLRITSKQNHYSFLSLDLKKDEMTFFSDELNENDRVVADYTTKLMTNTPEMPPEDARKLKDAIDNAKMGVVHQEIIVRWKAKNWIDYRVVQVLLTTIFEASVRPSKVYGTAKDITDRIKQEQKYNSQLAYMDTYKKSSLGYAELNLQKDKMFNTKTKYPRLRKGVDGHSIENWASNISHYVLTKEKREEVIRTFTQKNLLEEYEKGNNRIFLEVPFGLTEDMICWVSFEVSMLFNPATGNVEGYVVAKDITDRIRDLEIGRTVIHMDYEVVMSVDVLTEKIEGYYRDNSIFVGREKTEDERYSEYMRCSAQDIVETERSQFVEETELSALWQKVKKEHKYVIPFTMKGDDGKLYRKRMVATKLRNFSTKLLLVVQDISDIYAEEHEKQRVLKQALKEAKEAENAKLDFLSRMSHDLRTPLNGILGMAEIAVDEVNEQNIKEYLERILSSGQLLLSLVNDILDISQLEENKMILRMEPYSVNEFLESVERVIGEQCKSKGLVFTCDLGELKDQWIIVDKLRFGQIFMNLLSNSVKYTPEGGMVLFEANTFSVKDKVATVLFKVKDTGIGMTKEFVSQAFDAFSQEHVEETDQRIGSGLGLSIVKQLLDLFGGEINVQSWPGEGTTIRVKMEIELTDPIEKKEQCQEINSESLRGKRVLVAEDQPLNAKILTKMLNRKEISVDLAENGKMAVATYLESDEYHYDAILMDVRMPVMGGLDATRVIRSHRERKDCEIPIIATTANAFVEDKIKCIEAGMNDHISKPISAKELYRCLDMYIR